MASGVIMISHNLDDIGAVADRVVVLRHGRNNGVFEVASTTAEQVHEAMTGAVPTRSLFGGRAPRPAPGGLTVTGGGAPGHAGRG